MVSVRHFFLKNIINLLYSLPLTSPYTAYLGNHHLECFSYALAYNQSTLFFTGVLLQSKPYTCDACHRSYAYSTSLYSHKKYECGKSPQFACPVTGCQYRSKTKGNIKQHLKHRHTQYYLGSLAFLTSNKMN